MFLTAIPVLVLPKDVTQLVVAEYLLPSDVDTSEKRVNPERKVANDRFSRSPIFGSFFSFLKTFCERCRHLENCRERRTM